MLRKVRGTLSTSSNASTEELLAGVLQPLARLLAAGGVTAKQIQDVVNSTLGAPPEEGPEIAPVHLGSRQRDCMEVMCLWRRHPAFLTSQGTPAALPIRGNGRSFRSLCETAQTDNSPDKVLESLIQFDAVATSENNFVEPMTPTFLLGSANASTSLAVDGILKQLAGFIRVIEHNVLGTAHGQTARFERACSVTVAEELIPVAHRVVRERGQEFIDSIDEWLERHSTFASPSNRYVEIGVGAYLLDLGTDAGVNDPE